MPLFARKDIPQSIDQGYRQQCRACTPVVGQLSSFSKLRSSAESGCLDCQVIVEGIDASGHSFFDDASEEIDLEINLRGGDTGPLVVEVAEYSHEPPIYTLSFFVTPETSIKNPNARIGNHISATAGSPSCFATARMWLDLCRTQHNCHEPDADKVPRRLLEVGSSPHAVRLVDTRAPGFNRSCEYVCLSYCWGTSPKESLLQCNLVSMIEQGVQTRTQIFRDAIVATSSLCFRYLWIDALCIVQDDRQDWEMESWRMGDIYSNAAVTIIAASAKDSSSSFLKATEQRRRSQALHVCKSPELSIRPDVFVREFIPGGLEGQDYNDIDAYSNPYARGYSFGDYCEIDKRAWTLQEELLSSRTLRFETTGLIFKCSDGVWTEDGRTEQPYRFSQWVNARKEHSPRKSTLMVEHQGVALLQKWQNIVHAASRRNITYASDALPCLSGLAARYLRLSDDNEEYLAGLWKRTFINGLLWNVATSPLEESEPVQYLAPSWSWASVRGPVQFMYGIGTKESEGNISRLVEARSFPVGENPLGQLAAGYAIIEGPCKTMMLKAQTDMRNVLSLQLSPHGGLVDDGQSMKSFKPDRSPSTLMTSGELHVLCLRKPVESNKDTYDIISDWIFLVVKKTPDKQEELFERVGLWSSGTDDFEEDVTFLGNEWLQGSQTRSLKII